MTVISLPATPLLELVCRAVQRNMTATWLTLTGIMIPRLYPDPPFPLDDPAVQAAKMAENERLKNHADEVVVQVLPVLLNACLPVLMKPGGMSEVLLYSISLVSV
jgi:hypothetical protein